MAARGHAVEIFEKRDGPGGRAYAFNLNGFRFDSGPTLLTAPFMFDDLFTTAGKRREDYIKFVPLSPFYRIYNHDGRWFDYDGDLDSTLDQIARWNPDDRQGYVDFLQSTQAIFQKGFVELVDYPFLHFSDMMKVAPDLVRLQSYKSVYSYIAHYVKNDFLRQAFSFHPLLIGGNPFDTTSIYTLIEHLERKWGVHYAVGGTGALVAAMARLFGELGGKIHYGQEVTGISVDGRKVKGLTTREGMFHPADVIVSNGDVAHTYMNLISPAYRRKYSDRALKSMKYSMSVFVLYFGTRRRYNDTGLKHHNIILGPRYKGLLDDIFNRKVLADDFSLYLHMPTYTDPTMAPEGCENFYALVPVPNLQSNVDWKQYARPFRDRIVKFLQQDYLPDLENNIIAEHFIDPLHFRDTLNSYQGSAFAFQPVMTQSAWFRPHNRSEEFDNLYFVGAGTHPGAGLPGVLSSSIIADKLISETA